MDLIDVLLFFPESRKRLVCHKRKGMKQVKPIKHIHMLILYQKFKIFEAFLFPFKSWITRSKHITLIFFAKAHITRICC